MSLELTDHLIQPKIVPSLDPSFQPLSLVTRAFNAAVALSAKPTPLAIVIERESGRRARYDTSVFTPGAPGSERNLYYTERLLKSLLWMRGGWRVYIGGPREIGEAIQRIYSPTGERAFDVASMGCDYEQDFTVIPCDFADAPAADETFTITGSGDLSGCRIGFDAGASFRKVAAVKDGEVLFSEAMAWDPQSQADPQYHYDKIMEALRVAAEHLPRVDAIGVSTAGCVINNRLRLCSLFRSVPETLFNE